MKLLLFLFAITTGNINSSGQGVFSNDTHTALQTVIYGFSKGLPDLKGQLISSVSGRSEYKCNLQVAAILNCSITQHKISGKDISSWKATLFTATDFNQAEQKYKEVFEQIVNAVIKSADETPYILSGTYDAPTSTSSNIIHFSLLPAKGEIKNVKIELSLHKDQAWVVGLRVYDKRFRSH